MTEIDDKLLQQFFEPARQKQIEDNGFTERVMRRLPDKAKALKLSNYWTADRRQWFYGACAELLA